MIVFKTVRYKNILSTGNSFTEVQLNKSKTTLIVGKNGSGKSTLLCALCFGLFGKPFRKVTKQNLINSINQSDALVEVEFTIGKKEYKVVRGIKPNIFEIYCNDVLINQDAKARDYQEHLERNILKLNFKSFTQIVILGSASFVPFMQLSASDRRSIIEDLLDIEIFSSMNNLVKEKLSGLRDNATSIKYDINITSEKIKLQKQNIEEHKKQNQEEINRKLNEIQTSQNQINELNSEITSIQNKIDELLENINDKGSLETKSKKLIQMEAKLESSLSKIEKDILFFEEHDDCPTCKQSLNEEFKSNQVNQRKSKKTEVQKGIDNISNELKNLNTRLSEIHKINQDISKHNNEIVKNNSTISAINDYINKLNKEISSISTLSNASENDNVNLKQLSGQLKNLLKEQEINIKERQYYDYASTLLKDTGIKTKIIKQYLPIMNKLINKYLNAMDFFVNFNIDENFDETIKSRHRDEFKYSNFSEGEKQKIDLSLLLTWRQIAKLKNSTNTNLLVLDEIFDSSLDENSMENLFKIFNEFDNQTNLFVISHRGDQLFDRFRSVIRFEKQGNFSTICKN